MLGMFYWPENKIASQSLLGSLRCHNPDNGWPGERGERALSRLVVKQGRGVSFHLIDEMRRALQKQIGGSFCKNLPQ